MKSKPSGSKKKDAEDMLSVRIGKDVKDRLHAEVAARKEAQGAGRGGGAPVTVTDIVKDAIEARDYRRVWEEVLPGTLGRVVQRMDEAWLELDAQRATMEVLAGWAVPPQQIDALLKELGGCNRAIKKVRSDVNELRRHFGAIAQIGSASALPTILYPISGFCVALVGGLFILFGMSGWLWAFGILL